MVGGEALDLDLMLSPIPGDAPTGVDLREDSSAQSVYYRIKDARGVARAAERRADADGAATGLLPEWRTILDLCGRTLATRSKDLEVACWLVEALVRARGFAGLRDGFTLLRGLVDAYWDGLHSLRDEEGVSTVVAPLSGLNGVDAEGTLIQPIRKVPITSGKEPGPFAAYHFDQAQALAQLNDKAARQRRIAAGVPTVEQFETALRESAPAFLAALLADIAGALAALDALSAILSERCGAAAPPTSAIRGAIEAVQDIVRPRVLDRLPAAPVPVDTPAAPASGSAPGGNGAAPPPAATVQAGAITNREDALRVLARVSDFFRTAEPHSPIAFALDDLVRRARMPLPELLAELLPDSNARRIFLTSAGIRPPTEG